MIHLNNLLQNNTQDPYFKNTDNRNNISNRDQSSQKQKSDNLTLSNNLQENLYSSSLKPTEQLTYEVKTTNLQIQYSFTNSLIQVQSNGSYNIKEQSGFLSMNISFVQGINKENDETTLHPFKINISLNFSISETQVNYQKGKKSIKSDIMNIVRSIMNELFNITKDGQNKNVILDFENNDDLKQIATLDKGKALKMIYNYISIISQMDNPLDKDGKRDLVKLLVKDNQMLVDYENKEISINITNIDLEFGLDYSELQEALANWLSENQG
jgi:hypothetical protein